MALGYLSRTLITVWVVAMMGGGSVAQAQDTALAQALAQASDAAIGGAAEQARITAVAAEAMALLDEYRAKRQELERLETYNQHLQDLVADQQRQLAQMDTNIEQALVVQQEIVPLMHTMLDNLEAFVQADIPIHAARRTERVQRLRALMRDAGVATAEKYRQIMDAYKIELDIGRKIESYAGEVTRDGTVQAVNFLVVGRILLAYQPEDRSVTAYWNKHANPPRWDNLPGEYREHVDRAMRIANKQSAPDLLVLPVDAPMAAQ